MDPSRIERAQAALQNFVYLPTLTSNNEGTGPPEPEGQAKSPDLVAFRPWSRQDVYARLRSFKVPQSFNIL